MNSLRSPYAQFTLNSLLPITAAAMQAAPTRRSEKLGYNDRGGYVPMNLHEFKRGDHARTVDGALVEIVKETEDGQWILVRYLADTEDPALTGTEDLCHESEIEGLAKT